MKHTFPQPVPEIPVADIGKAAAYYQETLGFTTDWGGDEGGIAGISRGDCRMFLTSAEFREPSGNVAPVLIWLNLDSNGAVDDLYSEWSGKQAVVVSPPESKSWGVREFTVADLDGNRFRVFHDFATPEREKTA